MIVKNESAVILECLASVRPLVDYILVQDTGSHDGTQQIVRDYLRQMNLPGEVYDEPWVDFATNRSRALARLRQRPDIDYALIMDADDHIEFSRDFDVNQFKQSMTADLFNVWISLPPLVYHRPQICSNRLPFRFRGVLHEFLEGPENTDAAFADGMTIVCGRGGARSRDTQKYIRDARVLENALRTEQDPMLVSRYTFYLAQSYRDAGDDGRALPLYLQRTAQQFWVEERYVSMYEAANIRARQGAPSEEVIGTYLAAYEIIPARGEALHAAMRYCRARSLFHQGYLLGKAAVKIRRPEIGLFLEDWIYNYGIFDEFSVLAYWTQHYEDCRDYAQRILDELHAPHADRERIRQNLAFAVQAMKAR